MRLEDLLTMRSGTDYHERGANSPHSQLNRMERGWTRFILDRPMVREPGTYFQYDSGAVILMSSLLEQRTGDHADVFAAKHLFPVLGIAEVEKTERAQYIFVVPEHDLVVVVTGRTGSRADQIRPLDFLYSHILPAAHN